MSEQKPYDEEWECVVLDVTPTGHIERPWQVRVSTPSGTGKNHPPMIEHTWHIGDRVSLRLQYDPTWQRNPFGLRTVAFRVNGRGPWIPSGGPCSICAADEAGTST